MRVYVLSYVTEYEGGTVWGVTTKLEIAEEWLRSKRLSRCDDGHVYDVYDIDEHGRSTYLNAKELTA